MNLVDGLGSGLGLRSGGIADVERAIMKAIGSKETRNDGGNVILVLDGLDFLLAAAGCEVLEVLDMIGELREVRILSNYGLHVLAQRRCRKTARLRHDHCHSGRLAPFAIAHYASRNIPHSFRNESSTPGEIDHERKGTRYRRGEGCQWCAKD